MSLKELADLHAAIRGTVQAVFLVWLFFRVANRWLDHPDAAIPPRWLLGTLLLMVFCL